MQAQEKHMQDNPILRVYENNVFTDDDLREYNRTFDLDDFGELFTVKDFKETVEIGAIGNYDGSGYWVKDNLMSRDEVFSTPTLDATHVIWFNK